VLIVGDMFLTMVLNFLDIINQLAQLLEINLENKWFYKREVRLN
jgi:hypothetical protein